MGCFISKVSPVLDIFKRSLATDLELQEDSRVEDEKIKLLFLGADDSGKKVVFDKMDHGHRYSKTEKAAIIYKIHSTVLHTCKLLLRHARETGVEVSGDYALILDTDESETITASIGTVINALWDDPGIKTVWNQRSELQIDESVEYWFTIIDKLKNPEYVPDKDDLMTASVHFHSGVKVGRRVLDNTTFEIYDVIRQRGQRRKWLHCFENVITAIVFVVDVSAYDQVRKKGFSTNVVMESLGVFEELCNDMMFADCPLILLLNNREAFEAKVKRKHIRDCGFVDYCGKEWDAEDGLRYFADLFLSKNCNDVTRKIYSHVTGPADQHITKALYNICKEVVLRQDMQLRSLNLD